MKILADGNKVTEKSYFFLLIWNEQNNRKEMNDRFKKNRLIDLTLGQYMTLWLIATTEELKDISIQTDKKINDNEKLN